MHSVKLLRSGKSGHSRRRDRPTVKILTVVIRAKYKHAECCLYWNSYDINANCEFKMICMQKMNVIAKISRCFSAVSSVIFVLVYFFVLVFVFVLPINFSF